MVEGRWTTEEGAPGSRRRCGVNLAVLRATIFRVKESLLRAANRAKLTDDEERAIERALGQLDDAGQTLMSLEPRLRV